MARYTGGCLCGALRYDAIGEPTLCVYCCCGDCRKASGSGFIPFMGFSRSSVKFSGQILSHRSRAANGGDSVRNSCAVCGGLVFGGEVEHSDSFTIYSGSLDEPLGFKPTVAIFNRHRAPWVVLPSGLKMFEEMPTSAAEGSDR